MSTADDYLFCEQKLIDRLKEQVPDFAEVGSAASLELITSGAVPVPSAWVFYLGDQVTGTPAATGGPQAKQQALVQLWAVVVAVYFADGPGMGGSITSTAGPFLSKVMAALRGWTPDEKSVPRIRRSTQQLPAQYEDGYGFYPLVYQIQIPATLGGM